MTRKLHKGDAYYPIADDDVLKPAVCRRCNEIAEKPIKFMANVFGRQVEGFICLTCNAEAFSCVSLAEWMEGFPR